MTTLNIPSSPSQGETYEANGVVYTWDGSKWTAATGSGGGGGGDATGVGADAWGDIAANGSLSAGFNASVARDSTGIYDVTFITPMPQVNYAVNVTAYSTGARSATVTNQTVTGFRLIIKQSGDGLSADDGCHFVVHSANAIAPQSGVGADAWGDVKGSSGNLNGGYNCTASKNSTGNYRVTFLTSMPNTSYGIVFGMGKIQKSINYQNKTTTGFDVETKDISTNVAEDRDFAFTVHASSTVTPTYTWTRDGTTLKPANDGDSIEAGAATFAGDVSVDKYLTVTNSDFSADAKVVIQGDNDVAVSVYPPVLGAPRTIELRHDGSATFSGNTLVGNFDLSESNTSGVRVLASGGLQLQRDSAASNSPRFEIIRGTGDKTVVINSDGSATFTGNVKSTRGSGDCFYAGPNTPGAFDGAGFVCDLSTKDSGNSRYFKGNYNGTEVFGVTKEGTTTFRNAFINLEPDNSANYVSTMVDGVETQVYNGPTLDVKELLLTLQTAAARIATLEAKVATLESDHTTLMNNNNNGGGY